jgi:ribonucleoside-diphosphate reductase alpha chain
VALTGEIMGLIRDTAYRTSVGLAQEKGAFPEFEKIRFGASPFVLDLAHDIQGAIAQNGIRNSHLLAVAPTGSVSLLANNTSSGIEPMLAFKATRQVRGADGQMIPFKVEDAACHDYRALMGQTAELPAYFVQAIDVSVEDQLQVMATAQACVDNAISKTVRLPASANAQAHGVVLRRAWALGLKGCAVVREGSRPGVIQA